MDHALIFPEARGWLWRALRLQLIDGGAETAKLEPAIREWNLRKKQNEKNKEKNELFGTHFLVHKRHKNTQEVLKQNNSFCAFVPFVARS